MTARALRLPPTHPEGRYPMIGGGVAALIGLLSGSGLLLFLGLGVGALVWLASRTPLRATPMDDRLVLAPVDGVVESVEENAGVPSELGLSGSATRIRVGAAPWSPAPIRAPSAGTVASRVYRPGGQYTFATDPEDPNLSRYFVRIDTDAGALGLVFASGGFAHRTIIDAPEGAILDPGVAFGHRRFGGWCDIYVPEGMTVEAVTGQTLLAAETAIAVVGEADRPAVLLH